MEQAAFSESKSLKLTRLPHLVLSQILDDVGDLGTFRLVCKEADRFVRGLEVVHNGVIRRVIDPTSVKLAGKYIDLDDFRNWEDLGHIVQMNFAWCQTYRSVLNIIERNSSTLEEACLNNSRLYRSKGCILCALLKCKRLKVLKMSETQIHLVDAKRFYDCNRSTWQNQLLNGVVKLDFSRMETFPSIENDDPAYESIPEALSFAISCPNLIYLCLREIKPLNETNIPSISFRGLQIIDVFRKYLISGDIRYFLK
ncbi:hypothetical protein ACOME3_010297 [Neoechinorhynchus agilis]